MLPTRSAHWLAVLAVGWLPALVRAQAEVPTAPARATEPAYVRWLEQQSMLYQAGRQARSISGHGIQWRHPYGSPQPRQAVRRASVWVLDYAGSVIARPGKSVIATWGDPQLWDTFHDLGVDLLHTGPIERAGGLVGYRFTPSIDGGFDRISLEIDPRFGTDADYRRLVREADQHHALIAGDLVPLHTGKGADFRLAQMAYRDYPGMYSMVQIRKEDWGLLPKVDDPWASAHLPRDAAEELTRKGYLPGLLHSNDASPKAKGWSGWSASGEVVGVDGKTRRWVFLHYFKPGQPTLDWLDPSCAGPRAIFGDVVRNVHDLGTRVVRLDAVPFLGIEPPFTLPSPPATGDGKPLLPSPLGGGEGSGVRGDKLMSRSYQHPLSVTATNELAFLVRKLGGWSFHELNVPLADLKKFTRDGPDLSYDFFTRAQCVHALLTGDATALRLAFRWLLQAGIQPVGLVHDLQNHDEITYQLVELDFRKDETFTLRGEKVTGKELKERILREMREKAAGPVAPNNKLYRPEKDGIATTFAGFVAAALRVRDPYHATADEREQIRRGHLLLATANAMQPGVFSLSSWDLVGALPLPEEAVAAWVEDGDYRWVNRGGVDLLGANPEARKSVTGLPRAVALYGPLPEQLKDADSFASRLKRLLAARKTHRIAEAELVAVPHVKNPAVCLLVMRLPEGHGLAVTALNFGRSRVQEEVDLGQVPGCTAEAVRDHEVVALPSEATAGKMDASGRLPIALVPWEGKTFVIRTGLR